VVSIDFVIDVLDFFIFYLLQNELLSKLILEHDDKFNKSILLYFYILNYINFVISLFNCVISIKSVFMC
jgi:hypothetical protein